MRGLKEQEKNKRIFFIGLAALLLITGTCLLTGCAREVRANAIVSEEPVLAEEPKEGLIEYSVVESSKPEVLESPTPEPPKTPTVAAAEEDIPAGGEIFTLGEGIYRETSSAKGKISISGVRSWYESKEEGERWFGFAYENISREILDVRWTVVWKDTAGNILRTDEGRHSRVFPGDSCSIYALPYPEKAVTYEFWIERERSKPIPPSITVNYVAHPTAKGNISVNYELEIQDKGTPGEKWLIEIEVKNITHNKTFVKVSPYLRERDNTGKVIPPEDYAEGMYKDSTEEGFHPRKGLRASSPLCSEKSSALCPGENKTFSFPLFWETVSLDFYLQLDPGFPSSLAVEYIPSAGKARFESYGRDYLVIDGGTYWRVDAVFSASNKPQKELIEARAITSSGQVFEEDMPGGPTTVNFLSGGQEEDGRWYWMESYHMPRQTARLELIERVQE